MLKAKDYSEEELERKKEEAERKARRGEIDPVHEYTFTLISKVISTSDWIHLSLLNIFQITGLPRPSILNFMFEQPLILDELDLLYKGDKTKSIVFYYQVDYFNSIKPFQESSQLQPPMTEKDKEEIYNLKTCKRTQKSITPMNYFMKNKDYVPG